MSWNYRTKVIEHLINNESIFEAGIVEAYYNEGETVPNSSTDFIVSTSGDTPEQAIADLAVVLARMSTVAFDSSQNKDLILSRIPVQPLDRDDDFLDERYGE